MNIAQTLYFNDSKDPYKDTFGWAAPDYHLMSWALSSLQLNKLYGKVDLYCNNQGADILIDQLGLPYEQVHLSHNHLLIPHEKLWALPKIFTYSLQTQPFLHIDGDVFLFDKLPSYLLQSNLISQNIEEATNYYLQTQKELQDNFSYFPKCVDADFKSRLPIKAVNAGILGGNDINFIQEYADLAFKYISKNISHLNSINVDRFNVFFEQHLFYSLAKEKKISIEVLINSTIKDNQYLYLGNFHETPCRRNYLHLLGNYKKDEHTCRLMASKLRELHPEYYYKIISLFNNKTKTNHFSLYKGEQIDCLNSFLKFSERSMTAFQGNLSDADTVVQDAVNTASNILKFLESLITNIETNEFFTIEELKDDFKFFSNKLSKVLTNNKRPSNEYIYGRDLDSVKWYCNIFSNENEVMNKILEKCNEINVIESKFDWPGLYNKHTRFAVRYYKELELATGNFYTLIIPEIFGDGFSIEDIDEMENLILIHLQSPMQISNLFSLMLQYVNEDIIENHLDEYKTLFFEMLKQLILKKAIKPLIDTKNHFV